MKSLRMSLNQSSGRYVQASMTGNTMVQTPTKRLSLDEFLALSETEPASEYINGKIVQKPMPQGEHSIIQQELSFALTLAFRSTGMAQAFPELRCTVGGRSIIPDIAVFRAEKIPRDRDGQVSNSFNLPPDWTIEILSSSQSQTRVNSQYYPLSGARN